MIKYLKYLFKHFKKIIQMLILVIILLKLNFLKQQLQINNNNQII